MLGAVGVGKGLNVKGKSAKKNRLSGFVPFCQISDNAHKKDIEDSPYDARTVIYFRNAESLVGWKQADVEEKCHDSFSSLSEVRPALPRPLQIT